MDEATSGGQPSASNFDAYLQQVEERKAWFLEQITQGGPGMADDIVVLSFTEVKALATGEQAGE